MTDARMPGHWLYDASLDGLSDRAWRTFVGSLMWSNDQGTDGHLPPRALRFLYPDGVDDATAAELIDAGKWKRLPSGYLVLGWRDSQTLAATVQKQREHNRARQQAYRDRHAEVSNPDPVTGDIPSDVTRDVTGNATGNALGQDRQGQASTTELKLAGNALDFAKATGCYECQRASAFGTEPCPAHRESA
jgi:hypothetical protein